MGGRNGSSEWIRAIDVPTSHLRVFETGGIPGVAVCLCCLIVSHSRCSTQGHAVVVGTFVLLLSVNSFLVSYTSILVLYTSMM